MVSRDCLTVIPEGWLINPSKTCLLRFFKDPMSLQRLPKVYMDKWSVTSAGTPLSFINRRKVQLNPALETWSELILNGWERLGPQLEEAA